MLRTNKLPKPRLQLTMIAMFVATGALGMIVQFVLTLAGINALLAPSPTGRLFLDLIQMNMLEQMLFAIALMVPTLCLVGMFVTFRVAGPLTNLERYFSQLAEGENPGECRFRKGDELQHLSELASRIGERMQELTATESGVPTDLAASSNSQPSLEEDLTA